MPEQAVKPCSKKPSVCALFATNGFFQQRYLGEGIDARVARGKGALRSSAGPRGPDRTTKVRCYGKEGEGLRDQIADHACRAR